MAMRQKRTAVAGRVPATTDLLLGQIGMNTRDGRVFIKTSDGTTERVITVGAEMSALLAGALKETTGAGFMSALGVGSSGFVLLGAAAAIGTIVQFVGLGGYRDIMVVGVGLDISSNLTAATYQMQVGSAGGFVTGLTDYPNSVGATSFIPLSSSTIAPRSFSLSITNFNRTNAIKPILWGGMDLTSTNWTVGVVTPLALDRVRFQTSTGAAYTAGTIYIFGRV